MIKYHLIEQTINVLSEVHIGDLTLAERQIKIAIRLLQTVLNSTDFQKLLKESQNESHD